MLRLPCCRLNLSLAVNKDLNGYHLTCFIQLQNLFRPRQNKFSNTFSNSHHSHVVIFSVLSRFIFLPETTTWHNSSENSFLFCISLSWCLSTVSRRLVGSLPQLLHILITSSYCLSSVSLISVPEASMVRIRLRHWCWNNEKIKADECVHWH